ncbi:anti-sigma factor domain-containing protein [Brackiella oedipodis]|uniref:anti-sigma factor domain-containing protein n=1 Tax=Brackiella oedipodis TaxID=124225 RepID=UPI000685EE72|nr:anti-sigma factor [Brackiella oedipodis]
MKFNKKSALNYEKLLESCAHHQKAALQTLYQAEANTMYKLAQKALSQTQFAEQALLNTFIAIWENAQNYERKMGPAKGWIYSILRFQIASLYQSHYDHLALSHANEPCFKACEMSQVLADLKAPKDTIHYCQVFEQLPAEHQNSIINMYFSPDSQEVVAARLGQSSINFREDLLGGLTHIAQHTENLSAYSQAVTIGEYALGGQSQEAAQKSIELLKSDPEATRILLLWETYLTEFITQLPAVKLNPALGKTLGNIINEKLQRDLDQTFKKYKLSPDTTQPLQALDSKEQNAPKASLALRLKYYLHNRHVWQGIALLCLLIALAGVYYGGASHTTDKWTAVMSSPQAHQNPAWLLKGMSNNRLLITPLVHSDSNSNTEFQLWTQGLDHKWQALTVLTPNQEHELAPEQVGTLHQNQRFVITLEAKGHNKTAPTGAVIYQGQLVPLSP